MYGKVKKNRKDKIQNNKNWPDINKEYNRKWRPKVVVIIVLDDRCLKSG